MYLSTLFVKDFRCHAELTIELCRGVNILTGDNGAGKTSVLEAVYALSRGTSFRGGQASDLIRRGESHFLVAGQAIYQASNDDQPETQRLAVQRDRQQLQLRIGPQAKPTLRDLALALPVQIVDPRIHRLIDDASAYRRRFMDWAVFHVEHTFADAWRSYQSALKQRNAALRAKQPRVAASFNAQLIASAEQVHALRAKTIETLAVRWLQLVEQTVQEDWALQLDLRPGWPAEFNFSEALARTEGREQQLGYTVVGPHRADLRFKALDRALRHQLSRGQQKLLLLLLAAAQADMVAALRGESPVMLVDDLSSEFGESYRRRAEQVLEDSQSQWIVTELEPLAASARAAKMFHVEHGAVAARSG